MDRPDIRKTTITVKDGHHEASITLPNSDLTMEQLTDVYKSLSLALGYHPDVVKEYLG